MDRITKKLSQIFTPKFWRTIGSVNPRLKDLLLKPVNGAALKAVKGIKSKFNAFKYWIVRDERKAVDDMFFKYENLPPFTKEYWFMHFNGVDPSLSRQMMLSFIKFSSGAKGNKMDLTKKPGIACWFFDKKKHNVAEMSMDVDVEENRISSPLFCFEGSYPNYSLKVSKDGREICNLKFSEPETGKKYAFGSDFVGPLGFELIDLYLDFKGRLNSKPISGKSLVQKVIATTPFLPWNWGQIHFKDGSKLDFFVPQLEVLGIKYEMHPQLRFYHSSGRVFKFKDVEIKKIQNRWEISAANGNLSLAMSTYCSSKFLLESIGKFHYDEYLTEVTSFSFKNKGKVISLDELGYGSGMVEDAYGFTF